MDPPQHTAEALEVVQAQPSDLDGIADAYREAAQWLIARGIHQWPPHGIAPDFLLSRIERGEVYLARVGDEIVGTLRLQHSDPLLWKDVPDNALYLHGLVVRRAFAGRGMGRRLLAWAEERARAAGRRYLRLDCWDGNTALRRYYEGAGFTDRGSVQEKQWRCRLFEREIRSSN